MHVRTVLQDVEFLSDLETKCSRNSAARLSNTGGLAALDKDKLT